MHQPSAPGTYRHVPHAEQSNAFKRALAKSAPYFRDRMMADNLFLFKCGVEILIDSGVRQGLPGFLHELLRNQPPIGAHILHPVWEP